TVLAVSPALNRRLPLADAKSVFVAVPPTVVQFTVTVDALGFERVTVNVAAAEPAFPSITFSSSMLAFGVPSSSTIVIVALPRAIAAFTGALSAALNVSGP